MPKKSNPIPPYERGKNNTARVRYTLQGRRHEVSLGRYGSAESKAEYRRVLSRLAEKREQEAQQIPHIRPIGKRDSIPVAEVCAQWVARHLADYSAGERSRFKSAVRILITSANADGEPWAECPAEEFGPLALTAIRDEMIRLDWTRQHINQQIGRIRRIFDWAASIELIPPEKAYALRMLKPLRSGRSQRTIQPVDDARITATVVELTPTVAGMVEFQRLTGCRPQDVCRMQITHIERTSPGLWHYRPPAHKNSWRGQSRVIPLGPRSIAIVLRQIGDRTEGHVFSPAQACEEHTAKRKREAKPKYPSWVRKERRGPSLAVKDHYTVDNYGQAIERAAERAGVAHWTPNQLRHARLTEVRERHGLDAAQAIGGHRHASTTERYAKLQSTAADKVAEQEG